MRRSRSRAVGLVAGLAVLTLGLTACGSSGTSDGAAAPDQATGKVQVVASTDVWGSIVARVGGDRVAVTSIIDSPDKDPHEYESTPADAAAVGKAQLVIANGGGYDEFMTKLVQASGTTAPVIDAFTLRNAQSSKPEENEHVWYDTSAVQAMSDALRENLIRIDPAGADVYNANGSRLFEDATRVYTRSRAIAEAHPGAAVAVTEPVPDYLVEGAGLRDATPSEFTEAIEEGNDPPAAVVQQTLALFSPTPKVGALVVNAQTQTPVTDQVRQAAQRAGVPVVEMTETLPQGTTDWAVWMTANVDALAKALDRR